MPATASILADVPIFALLDDSEREALVPLLETERFSKDQIIYRDGDPGDTIYIVRNGRAQVWVENYEGQKLVVSEPCVGDVFGEISFLDGGARTATACAIEDLEVLTLDRERLLEFIDHHAHAALDLLTVMGQRWRLTDQLLRKHVVRNVNVEEQELLTFGQRIADKVATFGGSWTFIISFGIVIVCWMATNTILLRHRAFDPYPYILLNLVLSCLAALQAPVIMMSQNRQAAKDRLQADADYEVNLKAELEISNLHKKVDQIYEAQQAHFARDRRDRDWGRMT
jgi:CRP/FNR family transcriptional regulator, cyclic AMP receptor protein